MLEKTMGTLAVAWHDRAALADELKERIMDNGRHLRPVLFLFLLVFLGAVVAARVSLAHDQRIEAAQIAAAEEMRLDLQRQEAVRASTLAAERARAAEAAAAARSDREAVARVLYGTALHHSEDAQRAVCWCIINRVESSLYPDSIIGVCEQDSQWMGFSDENPVISGLYEIADEVITAWESGEYRPMSPDYLFLSWTSTEIVLRTSFNETAGTHYWRAG